MRTATIIATGNDDYTQPGNLFRLMSPDAKAAALPEYRGSDAGRSAAISSSASSVHFAKADPAYAEGVRQALRQHPQPDGVGRGEPEPELETVGA